MTTIADVAKATGVSVTTVSRVLNGHPHVSSTVAARVRKKMSELDYRPSQAARTLRARRSRVWSLILADIRNPFFTEAVRGVERAASDAGYSIILANTNESPAKERASLQLAVAEQAAGIILVPSTTRRGRLTTTATGGIPVVTLDRRAATQGFDCVLTDSVGGAREAVAHLVDGGYERVACISGPEGSTTGRERMAGYRLALADRGVEADPLLSCYSDFSECGGYREMEGLLRLTRRPDAVFVANNVMTIGALRAIADDGLRIPNDIAVVGFDEMSWSRLLNPPLTTVAQPSYDLGLEAARLLLSRLSGYDGAAREVMLTPALHIRASSAPKKTGAI